MSAPRSGRNGPGDPWNRTTEEYNDLLHDFLQMRMEATALLYGVPMATAPTVEAWVERWGGRAEG